MSRAAESRNFYLVPTDGPVSSGKLCASCAADKHRDVPHGLIGCMELLGKPPHDDVCQCTRKGKRRRFPKRRDA